MDRKQVEMRSECFITALAALPQLTQEATHSNTDMTARDTLQPYHPTYARSLLDILLAL